MLREHVAGLLAWRRWLLRTTWMARTQIRARLAGAELELEADPTASVSASVDIRCRRGTRNVVRIGAGCRVDDDVFFQLAGGTVVLGPECELRQRVVLNVSGRLELEGRNILSWGTTVHCNEQVVLELEASASEHVTITDSRHYHPADGSFFYHHAEAAPVRVGANSWLASKSTVLMGTHIGEGSVVGANSVVSGSVAPWSLMAGAPARRIRDSRPSSSEQVRA